MMDDKRAVHFVLRLSCQLICVGTFLLRCFAGASLFCANVLSCCSSCCKLKLCDSFVSFRVYPLFGDLHASFELQSLCEMLRQIR